MAKKLTAIAVENERPGKTRREVADLGTGLFLVVQPSGNKSWAVRYRYVGKPRKLTLGSVLLLAKDEPEPDHFEVGKPLTLAAARALAGDALQKLKQGRDPAAEKQHGIKAGKSAAALRAADSVETLSDRFLKQHVEKKNWASTRGQVDRILKKEVLTRWKGRSVHDINKDDVLELLDAIAENRPTLANRTLAIVRRWFNWMIERNIIKILSPCTGVKPPSKENRRERVLTQQEIVSIWKACDEIGKPFGPFVKLLLLTGQRRSEVAGMRWSEIDSTKKTWTLPSDRTKNQQQHTVPLSPQAWTIIEAGSTAEEERGEEADYVLSKGAKSAISGFSRAKRQFDKITGFKQLWTYHDIRRSVVTHMADDLGVQPHVIEAIVNHISGHKAGVAGIYNRATYAAEKRDALEKWADHIDAIVAKTKASPSGKVIRGKFSKRRA